MPPALATALPLPRPKLAQLAELTQDLDAGTLWWLSGYVAGLAQGMPAPGSGPEATHEVAVEAQAGTRLTIVYGSQTGNSRRIAEALAQQAEASGLAVRLLRADAYPLRELKQETQLALVFSTQGEGEPSDDARGFVEHLLGARAPKLPQLQFTVLGLGDSSYPQFCAIGRKLDARLLELGAQRWLPRADADLDVETVAQPWLADTLAAARAAQAEAATPTTSAAKKVTPLRIAAAPPAHGRERPFAAEVLGNQRLTGRGSAKDVRHLELSLADSGLRYEPGDALGLWPRNPPALVQQVLDQLRLDGDAEVAHAGHSHSLHEWLESKRELTRLSPNLVVEQGARSGSADLRALVADESRTALRGLLRDWQPIDLWQRFPAAWKAEELVAALRPLAPRLYSIASSTQAVGDEAHLTVAHVAYEREGAPRWGAASHLLAQTDTGGKLEVYIEPNERFRLPRDPDLDLVMIGAGTGVAPFRGFLQERVARGARGRHWLLFGNPHSRTDFLYQSEWQQALRRGQLQRLDLAFSRDAVRRIDAPAAPAKIYVQDRLREHGKELLAWLDEGAQLYVCGALAMAQSVHATLRLLLQEQRGLDNEAAEDYLAALQAQGRYARDAY
jgi:sulfite reductase (NADPH) flavoprotein alpha-component